VTVPVPKGGSIAASSMKSGIGHGDESGLGVAAGNLRE